jgi:hypothetical protein
MESRGWARGKQECGGRVRIFRISNRSDVHALQFAGPLRLLTRERRGCGSFGSCSRTAAGERAGEEEGVLHLGFLPKVEGKRPSRGRRRPHSSPYGVTSPSAMQVRRERRRANDDMK